jgi:uncharacterized membrane protein YcaP (DUF421 family)
MGKDDIRWDDWRRIFIGEVPGEFYFEIVIRLAVVYMILVFSMRMMGKRMATQLTRTEYAALVSLAAATGMNALTPERGLLPSVVIAIVLIFVQRLLARQASLHNRFEKLLMGKIDVLVEDGKLNLNIMKETRITREKLFAELRGSNIKQLGEVQRFYFESGGDFSLLKAKETKAGLSVIPNWDHIMRDRQKPESDCCVCKNCGNTKQVPKEQKMVCDRCGSDDSEYAVS